MISGIPVIDLFAGPGGLGEGFSSYTWRNGARFRIAMSVEKDEAANRTLRLRSLVRKLNVDELNGAYSKFAKSRRTPEDESLLYRSFNQHSEATDFETLASYSAAERELGSNCLPPALLDALIRERLDGAKVWVLIGGPPCQAYSIAGRAKIRSLKETRFDEDKRHFLYKQYLRILATHHPPVFVMENVKGMLSSRIGGQSEPIVERILDDLQCPRGARIEYELYPFVRDDNRHPNRPISLFPDHSNQWSASDFLIKAEEFGVPQARHRVIILGIRKDLGVAPGAMVRHDATPTVAEALGDLPPIRSRVSQTKDSSKVWKSAIYEILRIISNGDMPRHVALKVRERLRELDGDLPCGADWMPYRKGRPPKLVQNLYRREVLGVTGHESRRHMPMDLLRYFFASCYAEAERNGQGEVSPKLSNFPRYLLPEHGNVNRKDLDSTYFKDRFRVQVRGREATTITSHIAKDGHYFIHYDPLQCRSLTVREAARLQTFPDDYVFLGFRTDQYCQVGNAVPPLLARQLASVVFDVLRRSCEGGT